METVKALIDTHSFLLSWAASSLKGSLHAPTGYAELDNSIYKGEINHDVNSPKLQTDRFYQKKNTSEIQTEQSRSSCSPLSTFIAEVHLIHLPLRSRPSAIRQWGVCNLTDGHVSSSFPSQGLCQALISWPRTRISFSEERLIANTLPLLCYLTSEFYLHTMACRKPEIGSLKFHLSPS